MRYVVMIGLAVLGGCDQVASVTGLLKPGASDAVEQTAPGDPLAAPMSVEALPKAGAVSTEPVSTEPVSAAPVPASGGTASTIAALGDPSRGGAWMETPLVTVETAGEVRHGGKGLKVTLIPAGGPVTGGSRLSLEAMQALGLPLTELSEVQVVF